VSVRPLLQRLLHGLDCEGTRSELIQKRNFADFAISWSATFQSNAGIDDRLNPYCTEGAPIMDFPRGLASRARVFLSMNVQYCRCGEWFTSG
jgi:hypothetical protein